MKLLECSTKGDIRFSARNARVTFLWTRDFIENHYQLAKRFGDLMPETWYDAKGRQATHMSLEGIDFDVKYTTQFYYYLWYLYLEENPELVNHAYQFDDFTDIFCRGKSRNCQNHAIRMYIKEGREKVLEFCGEFLDVLEEHFESFDRLTGKCKVISQ